MMHAGVHYYYDKTLQGAGNADTTSQGTGCS